MTSRNILYLDIWFVFDQLMFVCHHLVLFLRHYTLKRTVMLAEDVEKAVVLEESDQGSGKEYSSSEDLASEPSNDNGNDDDVKVVDVDEKRSLEGRDAGIKQLESNVLEDLPTLT